MEKSSAIASESSIQFNPMETSSPSPRSRNTSRRSGVGKNRNAPRASLACLRCRERKIKCDAQTLEGGRGRCTPCRSSCTECIIKHDDERKWRAPKNYIITLEERIKSLEETIRGNLPSNPPDWNRRNESIPEPDAENYASPTQDTANEQQLQVAPADRGLTYLSSGRRWSQVSYETAQPVVATPVNARHPPVSATNPGKALHLSSTALQIYNETSSNYSHMDLPTIPQVSTAFPRPLPSWTDIQQPSSASNNRSDRVDHPENLDSNSSRHVEEGRAIGSYPSPLSESIEPPIRVRPGSPSYEVDRQVKEKVRLRCFGPTCPLHVLLRPNPPDLTSTSKDLDSCLPSLDSEQLQKELLTIYWEFQPLSVIVVQKETFMEHFSHGTPSEYYSNFLLNCILACAVRLSTRITIRRLSALYIKRAKVDLVNALEQATIATVQGFCLLSDFEMSGGQDQAGWLYAGIACRLLFDLGLHQDCSDLVRTGHLSEIEAAIRRQAFFSSMVNERLWCIYLGRPSLIKVSDFSTPRPKITDSSFEIQTQAAWVDLSLMSSEISDIFNCPSLVDEQTIRRLSEVDTRLHSWHDSLPHALKSSDGYGTQLHPCVFALHMQFCGIQILVYRTSIMTRRKFSPAAFSEEEICRLRGHTLQQSRSTYHYNAVRIARLLATFKKKVGLERVPTVMLDNIYIATIALISYVSRSASTGEEFEADIQWIVLLLDALEALQMHYPVAVRMRLTLSDVLQRSWLANSANSPLYYKLTSRSCEISSADARGEASPNQRPGPPYTQKRPPIFDTADLWVIPENFGDIGYPQHFDGSEFQTYEGMDLDRGAIMDMTTYAVNGMDLLEM